MPVGTQSNDRRDKRPQSAATKPMGTPAAEPTRAAPPPRPSLWERWATLDVRSLAACRIGLALTLLADVAIRWREAAPFMSDRGMFPRAPAWERMAGTWLWSLNLWSGAVAWQQTLLVVLGLAALALLLGFQTRWATLACWILVTSLQVRNLMLINAGDALLRMMLFWGMFVPWGRRWSLDGRRRLREDRLREDRSQVTALACVAPVLQLTLVYVVTGVLKCNSDWFGGEAMRVAYQMDFAGMPLGRWLAGFPQLLTLASPWIVVLEIALPLLLWSPWRTGALRMFVVTSMILFHVLVALTIHVGLFAAICSACWLIAIPGGFWDALRRGRRTAPEHPPAPDNRRAAPARGERWANRGANALLALSLLLVLAINARSVVVHRPTRGLGDQSWERGGPLQLPWLAQRLGDFLALHQEWNMFDRPPRIDTWIVARGLLADGRELDVLRDAPWDERGGKAIAARLPSQHWRYFLHRLTYPEHEPLRPAAAQYLFDSWNRRHSDAEQLACLWLVEFREEAFSEGFESRILYQVGEPPPPTFEELFGP